MIELNCKTTTNYNKVWGWLKTQVIIGLSTNSSYMLSLFYNKFEKQGRTCGQIRRQNHQPDTRHVRACHAQRPGLEA